MKTVRTCQKGKKTKNMRDKKLETCRKTKNMQKKTKNMTYGQFE